MIGDLHVEGLVCAPLYVSGNIKCEFLQIDLEQILWVNGNAEIEYAISGYFNGLESKVPLTSHFSLPNPIIFSSSVKWTQT